MIKLRYKPIGWFLIALVTVVFSKISFVPAEAAVYWSAGVRSSTPSVCFVSNATTLRPERVQQILTSLKDVEYVANVKFNYLGKCAEPTKQANGNDSYSGDFRVLIPNVGMTPGQIPGKGCPMFVKDGKYTGENDGWGSWSNSPNDLSGNRACLYNLKLGDDPWPPAGGTAGNPSSSTPYHDHTLHEFGHGLGLAHEHERNDVDRANCTANGFGGGISQGFMTPYDRRSVMHYQFLSCGINGNYDNNGFSAWDKLALHILYPESIRTAEFIGSTVVRAGTTVVLSSAWKIRGANIDFVAKDFVWKLGGAVVSTSADLNTTMTTPQKVMLEFNHSDFLGRAYSYTGVVQVLPNKTYNEQIAAPVATQLPLL